MRWDSVLLIFSVVDLPTHCQCCVRSIPASRFVEARDMIVQLQAVSPSGS
jgi:hypothetical protein